MLQVDLHGAGVWIKDASRSDLAAYERALDLMGLNGLQKTTALRLIEGVEIQQDATTFSVNFLTVVPFFKVCSCHSAGPRDALCSCSQQSETMLPCTDG